VTSIIEYLKKVLVHKWYVLQACLRLGIPWLGVIHDLSKFSPLEFCTYVRKFGKPRDQVTEQDETLFRRGWLHHQHRNRHHWIYWVVYIPIPGQDWDPEWGCVPMPDRFRREMLADFRAMGRQYGNTAQVWYEKNRDSILLHPDTRVWLEENLSCNV
jgi:hypothetical protein